MYDILSVIALVLSLTGNILINYKKRIGYIVWIASNIAWIAVNVTGQFNIPMVIMYVVYVALNVQGFVLWSRKNKS
jgi:nicotinamide riboside transporter PnuC